MAGLRVSWVSRKLLSLVLTYITECVGIQSQSNIMFIRGSNRGFLLTSEAVEFQMSFDRRTGKPVAVGVVKVDPSVVLPEILSEEKVQGTILQEAKQVKQKNVSVLCVAYVDLIYDHSCRLLIAHVYCLFILAHVDC